EKATPEQIRVWESVGILKKAESATAEDRAYVAGNYAVFPTHRNFYDTRDEAEEAVAFYNLNQKAGGSQNTRIISEDYTDEMGREVTRIRASAPETRKHPSVSDMGEQFQLVTDSQDIIATL